MSEVTGIVSTAAQIITRANLNLADLNARVYDFVLDPSILSERQPFFWHAEVSSNRLDTYYTRMTQATLDNYYQALRLGIAFQNSHRTDELPLGRSLDAQLFGTQGNGVARLEATFYTLPDININGVNTTNFINGVRSGIVKDVSVGFYGGRYICAVCGRNMLQDWDCNHVPGMKYTRVDPATGVSEDDFLSFAWIDGANLAEVSAVFDGSTPGAAILKAVREAEIGRLPERMKGIIEKRYQRALPDPQRMFTSAYVRTVEKEDENNMADKEKDEVVEQPQTPVDVTADEGKGKAKDEPAAGTQVETKVDTAAKDDTDSVDIALQAANELAEVRAVLGNKDTIKTVKRWKADLVEAKSKVTELTTERNQLVAERDAAVARANELEALAEHGKVYVESLIQETLQEGVRAQGNAFPKDTFGVILRQSTIENIVAIRDGFKQTADASLAGGRKTLDDPNPPAAPEQPAQGARGRREVPDEAYK